MKKGLSLILSLLITACLIVPFCASAAGKTVKVGDMTFSVDGKKATLIKYDGPGGSVEVPDTVNKATVTEIGNQAFAEYYDSTPDSKRITKVVLPSTVENLGNQAFLECTKLKTIECIGVKKIGTAAFWYCASLKNFVCSSALKSIGENAFGRCPESLVFYGEKDSVAQAYAEGNNFKFKKLYPDKITFAKSTYSVEKTAAITIKPIYTPSDCYYKNVFYTVSNKNIIGVSAKGKVTGKNYGAATITCKAVFGPALSKVKINVKVGDITGTAPRSVSASALSIKWNKVKTASFYQVYKYDSAKSAFKLLTVTKNNYFTDTAVKAGKVYKYKVRAVSHTEGSKNINGSFCKEFTYAAKPLKLVKIKTSSVKKTSVKLSWAKNSPCTGYVIYSLKNGKYSKIASTKNLYYTVTGLNKNTEYTFAVRAYRYTTLGNVYSAYNTVNVTTAYMSNTKKDVTNEFFAAYENTVNTKSFYTEKTENLSFSSVTTDGSETITKTAKSLADAFAYTNKNEYIFSKGKDGESGLTPAQAMTVTGKVEAIAQESIKEASFTKNGSGYLVQIVLINEKSSSSMHAQANEKITKTVDFEKAEQLIGEEAEIDACSIYYTGTVIKAVINSKGKFDSLIITCPFKATVKAKINEKDITATANGTFKTEYSISWLS